MPEPPKPVVSALIVTHNARDSLLQCVQALFASADVPVEAVVVDSDSSDGSAAAVTGEYPKAIVLIQEKNLGFERAANVGLERCTGRFVLLLNPGVVVDQTCVGRLADFMLTRPDAGAVGPRLLRADGTLDPAARRGFPLPSTLFYNTVGLSKLFPKSSRFGRENMGHLDESDDHQIARNKRNSIVVISLFLIVWLLAGFVIGEFAGGTSYAVLGTVVLGLLGISAALFSYYFGAATVLPAAGAVEADPRQYQQLYNIVQTLAIGDGVPVPKVYIINDPSPNAFATGRDPQHAAVTVTTGLLQMMNREELEGVLAHEMSHVKNYDVRLLLVVTTMIGLAALIPSLVWNGALRFRTRDASAVATF